MPNGSRLLAEILSGDEIYSNGAPNLLVIGNESLYIYALTRQPTCDGETWGCVLLDAPAAPSLPVMRGRDWRRAPNWRRSQGIRWTGITCCARCGGTRRAWKTRPMPPWQAVEDRAAKFSQTQTPKRLAQHLGVWEQLRVAAQEQVQRATPSARSPKRWMRNSP